MWHLSLGNVGKIARGEFSPGEDFFPARTFCGEEHFLVNFPREILVRGGGCPGMI